MSTPIQIRTACERDIPAMVALLAELNAAEGVKAGAPSDAALRKALFGEARAVALQGQVAEVSGQVVGMLLYYAGYDTLTESYGYHLADMVVAASHRRQGVGRRLFVRLAEHTLAGNRAWISLTVLRSNASAQSFYASLGMQEVDVHFHAIGTKGLLRLISAK